jgi:hypothetical protein
VNQSILDESIEFWRAEEGQLGLSDPQDWETSQRIMRAMDLVAMEVDVAQMFTNRFVEEVEP